MEYTAETFAVYSVQENNIYEDERYDDFKLDISKPKTRIDREEAENNYITPVSNVNTLNNVKSKATTSTTTMTVAEQIYNTSQMTSPPSIYSVKYLVDLNDLKQHLNCDNCHSTKTLCHHATTTQPISNKNIYESQAQLVSLLFYE